MGYMYGNVSAAGEVIALIFLLALSISDVKNKKIFWPAAPVCMALAAVIHLVRGDMNLLSFLYSMLPGLALAGFSALTKGAVGMGDALAVLAAGTLIGFTRAFAALLVGLILAACLGIFLLIKNGTAAGKQEFPFLPFLLAGQLLTLMIGA